MSVPEREDSVPFHHPSLPAPAKTWYKVFGDLTCGKTPLVLLHGGPGACHGYLLPFVDLTREYGIPTIFYDQIGNGQGTRYPDKKGDEAFWTDELFRSELDNLVDHLQLRAGGFHVLGQSWGGMLGAMYAITQPKGLRRLVIANSPANMETWMAAAAKLKSQLPAGVAATIDRCEASGDYANPEYQSGVEQFYRRYLCRSEPYPAPELQAMLVALEQDSSVYNTMNGPSEFTVVGSLRNWSIVADLHKIQVPTLLLNGVYDEAQDECVAPYFEHIPHAKWVTFDNASHFSHVEQREKTMRVVGPFLIKP